MTSPSLMGQITHAKDARSATAGSRSCPRDRAGGSKAPLRSREQQVHGRRRGLDIDQGRGERLIDHLSTILQLDIGAAALVIEIDFNVRVRCSRVSACAFRPRGRSRCQKTNQP